MELRVSLVDNPAPGPGLIADRACSDHVIIIVVIGWASDTTIHGAEPSALLTGGAS